MNSLHPSEPDDCLSLARLRIESESCWTLDHWNSFIGDARHAEIMHASWQATEVKLWYDSWLWYQILNQAGAIDSVVNALELLPGTSFTIPIALTRKGFVGTLDRVDEAAEFSCPKAISFPGRWIQRNLLEQSINVVQYDLILGNHILDDLLISMEFPNQDNRNLFYADADLSKRAWAQVVNSDTRTISENRVVDVLLGIVERMKVGAYLVIRHYPPSIAITSGDAARIAVEMGVYRKLVAELRTLCVASLRLPDVSQVCVPRGSGLTNSFIVVQRLR